MLFTPILTSNKEILMDIKKLCTNRHYKCKGCIYSTKKLTVLETPATCIFANCPCDWELEEKND